MKKTRKGLMPALLGAVCSVVALTSVSYAWFTMGSDATVGEIEVGVSQADGMQISVNAFDWKSFVDQDELGTVKTNILPASTTKFLPTSSVGNYNGGKQEMFLGTMNNDKLTATKLEELVGTEAEGVQTAAVAANYIAFDLYIKLDSKSLFNLDSTSTVDGQYNSELASRISFTHLGTAPANQPNSALALSAKINQKIWEPNSKEHTSFVLGNNASLENQKVEYYGVKQEISSGIDPTSSNEALSKVETVDFADSTTDLNLFTLEAGISKIRVYIWLEGQDVDCNNDVSSGKIITNLKFEKADVPAGE